MKNAKHIVDKLLEFDYAGGYDDPSSPERPGGPKDMWRQGGYQKFDPSTMDISGRRAGEPAEMPEEPAAPTLSDEERAKIDADNAAKQQAPQKKIQPGMGSPSRFHWTPPTP